METLNTTVDFQSISSDDLNNMLSKFYAEASPKSSEKREKELTEPLAQEYHKNSMKNIRAAINRHVRDLERDFDIVKDKIFRKANDILDGKLKTVLKKDFRVRQNTKRSSLIRI